MNPKEIIRAKELINDKDFVVNPQKYFGNLIPKYYPSDTTDKGNANYGIFLACKRANEKAACILNPLVVFFYSEDKERKDEAYEELMKIAEQYLEYTEKQI